MAKSLKKLEDDDLLVAAFTAMQTNQYMLAVQHFKEVLRRDPGDPFAHLEMAKCYFSVDDPDKAVACVKKVFTHAKQDPTLWLQLANVCQYIRQYSLAIKALKEAELIAEFRQVSLVRQAEIYELSNKLTEAETALEKIKNSETQASLAIHAKLLKRRENYKEAAGVLEELISKANKDNVVFISSLQYELASVYDKHGHFTKAAEALEKAKSFHRGTDAYKIAERGRSGVTNILSGLCKQLDDTTLERWKNEAENVSSNLSNSHKHSFLLGHPRSGTTLIEQVLDAHPEVISADETFMFHNTVWMPTVLKNDQTETHFSELLNNLTKNPIRIARREYKLHWERSVLSKLSGSPSLLLDKNPALTTRLAVIARFFPDAPIVFALRDPRDVVISSYMQPVGVNDWSINWLTIEEAVDYYCFTMQMWLDIRHKLVNPWIEVKYEDCVSDFEGQAKRVTQHLGLEWSQSQEDVQQHISKKAVFSPTYADVGKAVYSSSVARWKNYKELLNPHLDKLMPFIKEFGYEL